MTLKEYKEKRMQDPDFASAYFEMQPEINVIRALVDARISQNMSQKELSESEPVLLRLKSASLKMEPEIHE